MKKNPYIVSCETATLLIEKKQGKALNFSEKIQLFVHKMICDACRRYEKQSHFMESILKKNNSVNSVPNTTIFIDEEEINNFRGQIINELDNQKK